MKTSPFLWILTLVLALIPPQVRAAASADAAWKKVQYAMSYMERERSEGQSRDHLERTRVGLSKFDAALQEFVAVAPHDPRLWEARVFDAARLAGSRRSVRYPAPTEEELMKAAEEALAAPEASSAAKAMASAFKLNQLAPDASYGKFPRDDWMRLADAHLKDYPGNNRDNDLIQGWRESMRTTMDLMALPPIDAKLISIDGTEVDLAKLRGKVVLLYFWSPSKYYGNSQMAPIVGETYQKHHANGFEVIGIAMMNKSELISYLKQSPTPWPQVPYSPAVKNLATRYKNDYGAVLYLFNKKGTLAQRNVRETLPEHVEKLLME